MSRQDLNFNSEGVNKFNYVGKVYNTSSDIFEVNLPTFNLDKGDTIKTGKIVLDFTQATIDAIHNQVGNCLGTTTCLDSIVATLELIHDGVQYKSINISNTLTKDDKISLDLIIGKVRDEYRFINNEIFRDEKIVNNLTIKLKLIPTFIVGCPVSQTCQFEGVLLNKEFDLLNENSLNVIMVDNLKSEVDFTATIGGDLNIFTNGGSKFTYSIHKYNEILNRFERTPEVNGSTYEFSEFVNNQFTFKLNSNLVEYDKQFFVNPIYIFTTLTEFGKLLGVDSGYKIIKETNRFSIYDETPYFIIMCKAQKPTFGEGLISLPVSGALNNQSFILKEGETTFRLPSANGDVIATLNGLTLAIDEDFTMKEIQFGSEIVREITFIGDIIEGDVLTLTYTNGDAKSKANIKTEKIEIISQIVSGATSTINNKVFFNTTTNKYELFLEYEPIGEPSVILNGVTLAPNIDYYKSTTNPKRLILQGSLMQNDLILINYGQVNNIQGDLGIDPVIVWELENPSKNEHGVFTLEISKDKNFTTLVSKTETPHIKGSFTYSLPLTQNGNFGETQYYRVKNEKKIKSASGTYISHVSYSDTVDFKISSNLNNSY